MASTNRFFDQTGLSVVDGAVAKASQLNSLTGETNKAFDLIESEINNVNVGYLLSFQWANNEPGDEIDPVNYPGRYSSYANALEAQGWAVGPAGTATEADGVTVIPHSAKEEADKANASAIQAASSESICTDAENMAQEWAENPEDDPITGVSGSYSALSWAAKAKHSEDNAQSSEDRAVVAEGNAAASETAAYNWAEFDPIGGTPVPEGDGSERSAHYWANQALGALSGVADILVTDPVIIDKTDPQIPIIGLRSLTSADVGLDQVDNTSDLNKPISTATQAALDSLTNGKVTSVSAQTPIVILGSAVNPIVTWTGDSSDVGLGDVDNTSDADKPISDATQAALDTKEPDLGDPLADGQFLSSDQAGVRSWKTVTAPNGLPVGGTTDQMLVKQSNADYDTWWQDQPDPGTGGEAGGLEWVAPVDFATEPTITAETGKGYPLYSSQTLLLPAAPAQNDQVGFKDFENNFGVSPAFIDPNGNPIEDEGTGIFPLSKGGQGGQLTWIEDRWSITNATDLDNPTSPATVSGAYVTGNVYGGELSYVDGTTFNVASVSCMSDDLTQPLALVGPTLVDLGSPLINTVYNVFIVRTTGGVFEIQTDTDVDGGNLTGITQKRWLGFVRINVSGAICRFIQNGDSMSFAIRSENHLPDVSVNNISSALPVDHSGMLPVPRIATIWYGARGKNSSNGTLASTLDGVNSEMYIVRNNNTHGDNDLATWGDPQYTVGGHITFDANRLFYRDSQNMTPLIRAVTLKR